MPDLKPVRDRISTIAHTWSVSMHGVIRVYDFPAASYGKLEAPSVGIFDVTLPEVSFSGGYIASTYGFTVNFLLSPNESLSFDAALEALPMMVEDLATDLDLNTLVTGNLSVVGGDPAIGIFDYGDQTFLAAQVNVLCGFYDTATVS